MTTIKLSTLVSIPKSEFTVSYNSPIFLIGSCFTESIGEKLLDSKFDVLSNPNGIIFNPISVVNALRATINKKKYSENDLKQHNGKWLSFDHHGVFSSFNKEESLSTINNSIEEAHEHIKKSKTIFITFGSAWVYEYPDVGVVANCHKIPNKNFSKRLLSVKEILNAFEQIRADLTGFNVVFTVSPVRHAKDGLHENNLSKSTLLLAINNLVEQHSNFHYFPAYEIVIDELRDYRFYKDDMVHPTSLAVNYIWEKFINCYFNENTQELLEAIKKIKLACKHKPFNFKSEEHQLFIEKQIAMMNKLVQQFNFLDFTLEIEQINQLK